MLTQDPPDLEPFLGSDRVERLRQNYSRSARRYLGGDGTVGTSEVKDLSLKDGIFRTYEHLLKLLPLVSGDSSAAFGNFSDLQRFVCDNLALGNELGKWTDPLRPAEDPVAQSLQRSLLASLPSLAHFTDLAGSGKIGLSEVSKGREGRKKRSL